MQMKWGKKEFSGKRPKIGGAVKITKKEEEPKQHPRFGLKFGEGQYVGDMETTRDTAERVVKRLLGETTEPALTPARARMPEPRIYRPAPVPEARTSSTTVTKAWKKGKKTAGHAVAGKPGKLSYREALMREINEKLKMKAAGKGKVVAKKPGAVSYKKEDFQVQEKMASGSGIKGGKAKKLLNSIAKKPGAVGYGKK